MCESNPNIKGDTMVITKLNTQRNLPNFNVNLIQLGLVQQIEGNRFTQ